MSAEAVTLLVVVVLVVALTIGTVVLAKSVHGRAATPVVGVRLTPSELARRRRRRRRAIGAGLLVGVIVAGLLSGLVLKLLDSPRSAPVHVGLRSDVSGPGLVPTSAQPVRPWSAGSG